MRLDAQLAWAIQQCQQAGCETAQLDAELLLAHVLSQPRVYLWTWPERELDAVQQAQFSALVERRCQGEPVAYLLGQQEFWGLRLEVSANTLIPRADTETLVETALALALPAAARCIDLGTGTGAIALALAHERPHWQCWASDQVPEAVMLARRNAQALDLNIEVFQSDWWQQIPQGQFDLIVSNPPYIHPQDPHLQQGDVRFEPASALVGGHDGLEAYRQLLAPIHERLSANGWCLMEHGYDQAEAVQALMLEAGLTEVRSLRDLNGQWRVTLGRSSGA
ncbi:protein-(glutamine-N5) methyltransferase, release factor-specific [Terasakiispira papahanaumokuakeensis]|uniref:Release factor glutamine methyltransferase n=1 Tax=Terasakiispira papahanaumokuakeensis TaxID=197479 RepID=A0A1E2V6U9_9GAMM|nr:peptide chain release factor N(5)-glutamine methyltransferase [Terasakiispira papahanaumokuakeensis]ODC02643.1 protein-(glutamine-N5) methyltransferase, release factor-specific [Terasakiispira papahanaumokuakeensis]